jgi:hypothetical protein
MLWTACQKPEDNVVNTPKNIPEGSLWLSLKASKGMDTKALDLSGSTLNAYWSSSEKVKVFKAGTCIGTLDVTPGEGEKPSTATLAGTITAGISAGDNLLLLLPREAWDYTDQDGSLPNDYDYATTSVTVDAIDGTDVSTTVSSVTFQNQQSIYRFSFAANSSPLLVKGFTVSSTGNKLVQSRNWSGSAWTSAYGALSVNAASATSDPLYLALRNEHTGSADTYSFNVIGDDDILYLGEKEVSAERLENGKFLSAQSIPVTKATLSKSSSPADKVW